MPTYNFSLNKERELRFLLEDKGAMFCECPHAFWRAKLDGLNVTFYASGKLLVQGKNCEAFGAELVDSSVLSSGNTESVWMGTDESGKGDYFGPLVFAGAVVKKEYENELLAAGVNDSKGLTDKKIAILAKLIKKYCACSVVLINPPKYNELIAKMKNLNYLMGWGHARVIENILDKVDVGTVISDKFGKDSYILDSLGDNGRKVKLIQRTKAESDVAVAAASILARDSFVARMDKLSQDYGIDLPKGASKKVISVGRLFVEKYGKDRLGEVAKLHFKTSQSVLCD